MTDVINLTKKAFTWSVVVMTIAWSVGLSALAAPLAANAAECPSLEAGDLFKVKGNSAVYLLNSDMKRMYFPTADVYNTWYSDFSGVVEIDQACVSAYPNATNPSGVDYRPGARLVKVVISPEVYAVGPGNMRHLIGSEEEAKSLYGDNWASLIRDIHDFHWPNYTTGAEVDGLMNGMLVKRADSDTVLYIMDGKTHEVDGTLPSFVAGDVRTVSDSLVDALEMSADSVTAASITANPSQDGSSSTPAQSSGHLNVSLSASTPSAGNIPTGANASVMSFSVQAGAEAVTVKKLTVHQVGLSDENDVENLKIVDADGLVLGNIVTALNSNDDAVFTFPKGVEIAAGQSKTFTLRVGVPSAGAQTSNVLQFSLDSGSAIETSTNAAVSGSFPIKGSQFGIIGTTVGTVTVTNDGTVVDETPDVGDKTVTLNKFKVTAGATEDVLVETMTFLESGTAAIADYDNIELWDVTDNVSLGKSTWNAEGKVHFSGLNVTVAKGTTHRFELRTDVIGGSGLTMNADLVDGSDVLMTVKGKKYGFYLTATTTGSWNGKGSNDQTINSGTLTISLSSATPGADKIASGDDQLLAVWTFEAKGEPVLVTALTVTGTLATMAPSELTNFLLKDESGNTVAGPSDGSDSTTASAAESIAFSDNFTVPVGQHNYYLYTTVADTVSDSDTVVMNINAASNVTAKGYDTGDTITASGSFPVAANTQTVAGALLQAVTLTQPAARSVAKGAQDLIFMTGALRAANSGDDIVVTTIVIEDNGTGLASNLDNMEIWADLSSDASSRGDVYETRVSDTKQPTASTTSFTLTKQITVPKNGEIKVAVVADLSNAATASQTNVVRFDTDSGDVTGYGKASGATADATPTGSGQAFTVATSGTLTVSTDSSYPSTTPMLAYGGEKLKEIGAFKLAADNVESLDLDSIKITDDGSDDVIDTYYFYVGSTLLGSVSGGATAEIFLADNTMSVPANDNIVITVKADFAQVDGTTVTNGSNVIPTIAAASDIDTTGNSSAAAVDNTVLPNGPSTTVYDAYPEVSFNSGTPGGTLIPNANTLVAKLDIKAKGNGDITFENADGNSLTFTVAASAAAADSSAAVNWVLKDWDGNTLDTVSQKTTSTSFAVDFSTNDVTIPQGQTKTLYAYVDTTKLTTTGDSIQLYLDDNDADNIDWGIDGSGSYNMANIIFRGDLFGGAFNKQ